MNVAPRHLPQFSLRTALLLMVVVGVIASLWVTLRQSRETERVRQENIRLRNEVGELTIEPGEEDKVHAIAVPELEARTWKWRVYIPGQSLPLGGSAGGRQFGLQVKSGTINSAGSSWHGLPPGQHSIVIALRRDMNNHWEWVIRDAQDSGTGETRQTASANVEKLIGSYSSTSSGVVHRTQLAEPGSDLELLKFEMIGSNTTGNQAQGPPKEFISVTIHEGPAAQ